MLGGLVGAGIGGHRIHAQLVQLSEDMLLMRDQQLLAEPLLVRQEPQSPLGLRRSGDGVSSNDAS